MKHPFLVNSFLLRISHKQWHRGRDSNTLGPRRTLTAHGGELRGALPQLCPSVTVAVISIPLRCRVVYVTQLVMFQNLNSKVPLLLSQCCFYPKLSVSTAGAIGTTKPGDFTGPPAAASPGGQPLSESRAPCGPPGESFLTGFFLFQESGKRH